MAAKHPIVGALIIASVWGCVPGPPAPPEVPAPSEVRFPAIVRGTVAPNEEVAAARLFAEMRGAFEVNDFGRAAATSRELTEEFGSVPGSSEGLWILARSALMLGEHEEAVAASAALVEALPPSHPVVAEALVLYAEALFRSGDMVAATVAFLQLPSEEVTDSTVERIATAAARLDTQDLLGILPDPATVSLDRRAAPIVAELALVRVLEEDMEGAQDLARLADSLGVTGRADAIVAAVFAQDVSTLVPPAPLIGAVLPVTGSPSNQEYASLFMEGVEVALQVAEQDSVAVEFSVEDNRGTSAGTDQALIALEELGAVAVLGPLLEQNVSSASAVRGRRTALISPTARSLSAEMDAVYSMAALDPGAARTLAGAVYDMGFSNAVVMHPRSTAGTEEALAFEETFMERGGAVQARLEYDPGTTYFEESLLQVESLLPELLVLAVPAGDIELLAPQVAFFGLDTLDIQVAGTAGWTTASAIASVDQRHTDRLIAVSSSLPGQVASDLTDVFVRSYEERFRKTLRSLVPAIGFDMFRLVLASYGTGVRTPGDFVTSLEATRQFDGVTGTYSVVGGRIVRDFFPVRIYGGEVLPIDAVLPEPPDRTPGR